MTLKRLTLDEFNTIAETAHLIAFHEARANTMNRYDFAILVEDEDQHDMPLGYMACLEIDAETVWILHGGAFPVAKNKPAATKGFHLMVKYLRENYKGARLDTTPENLAMIKLAYSAGFVICGFEQQWGKSYVTMRAGFE